jgi:plastocyanin
VLLAATVALVLCSGPTVTVKGKVTVHKPDGSAAADASDVVVTVADVDEPVKGATASLKQKDRQFSPRVLAIAAGTEVKFPNDDNIKHNVFSNSANAKWDLGLFGKSEGKTKVFDMSGVAEIYCDVHPEMIAYVVVSPSKLFAITGKDGAFEVKGVPAGKHKLVIWERFANPRMKTIVVDAVEGSAPLEIVVDEKAVADDPHVDKRGMEYKGSREHSPGYH